MCPLGGSSCEIGIVDNIQMYNGIKINQETPEILPTQVQMKCTLTCLRIKVKFAKHQTKQLRNIFLSHGIYYTLYISYHPWP